MSTHASVTATDSPRRRLSLEKAVEAWAGFMVLLSVGLTVFVHPWFVWLTVFVGVNLFQQSFTGFCPAATVLKRMGFRPAAERAGNPG